MPDRKFQVEADQILPDGFAPGIPMEAGPEPGELADLMLKMSAVLEMIGGTFSVIAFRRELKGPNGESTDLWVPHRYMAKWDAFAPGASVRRQEEAAGPRQAAAPAPPPAPPEELTPEEIADHFPEPAEDIVDEPEPELTAADLEPEADEEHVTADPGVDPSPPGSNNFDMGGLLGNAASDDVLAGIAE